MPKDKPTLTPENVDPSWKIGIVWSVWHEELTQKMEKDARSALLEAGIKESNIASIQTPGSYEIPLIAQALIEERDVDGIIALGVVIQGQTHHAEVITTAATQGLMDVQLKTGKPIVNEILYVDEYEDAKERSIGSRAKGELAAHTLLHSLALLQEMRS